MFQKILPRGVLSKAADFKLKHHLLSKMFHSSYSLFYRTTGIANSHIFQFVFLNFLLLPFLKNSSQVFLKNVIKNGVKNGVLKNFTNFIGKHLCWSLCLIKLQAWSHETPTQVFSYEICEIFKNTYFEEHLPTIASGYT